MAGERIRLGICFGLRLVLGVVFLWAGALKMWDMPGFREAVASQFDIHAAWLAALWLIVLAEVYVG